MLKSDSWHVGVFYTCKEHKASTEITIDDNCNKFEMQYSSNSNEDILCKECEKNKAQFMCMECKVHLCESCEKKLHSGKALQGHTRTQLDQPLVTGNLCLKHNKEIDLLCKECNMAVCSHCLLSSLHKVYKIMFVCF